MTHISRQLAMTHIRFFVPGIAQPGGSKRGFAIRRGGKRVGGKMVGGEFTGKIATVDANPKAKDWKALVALVAQQAHHGRPLLTGPLCVTLTFHRPRPKVHYGNNGLKSWAEREFPTGRPDVLKLARAIEDGLTGILWHDDSQIVAEHIYKVYRDAPGVEVEVEEIE